MPIFEYKCDSCGNQFEKLVRRADQLDGLVCPGCGDKHLSQQYSTFAARAGGSSSAGSEMPSCPSGMCGNPGMCGNFGGNN